MTSNDTPAQPDPILLSRFVSAQQGICEQARAELQRGRKESHWMWFIFPQLSALGRSDTARYFGIRDGKETAAYLAHAILGPRLLQCCEALLVVHGRSAHEIFGSPDDWKLRSCMTLFSGVAEDPSVFTRVLERYFAGQADERTIELLRRDA